MVQELIHLQLEDGNRSIGQEAFDPQMTAFLLLALLLDMHLFSCLFFLILAMAYKEGTGFQRFIRAMARKSLMKKSPRLVISKRYLMS